MVSSPEREPSTSGELDISGHWSKTWTCSKQSGSSRRARAVPRLTGVPHRNTGRAPTSRGPLRGGRREARNLVEAAAEPAPGGSKPRRSRCRAGSGRFGTSSKPPASRLREVRSLVQAAREPGPRGSRRHRPGRQATRKRLERVAGPGLSRRRKVRRGQAALRAWRCHGGRRAGRHGRLRSRAGGRRPPSPRPGRRTRRPPAPPARPP